MRQSSDAERRGRVRDSRTRRGSRVRRGRTGTPRAAKIESNLFRVGYDVVRNSFVGIPQNIGFGKFIIDI